MKFQEKLIPEFELTNNLVIRADKVAAVLLYCLLMSGKKVLNNRNKQNSVFYLANI